MQYKKIEQSIPAQRKYERLQAKVVQQASDIEFLAMMSGVELPSETASKDTINESSTSATTEGGAE